MLIWWVKPCPTVFFHVGLSQLFKVSWEGYNLIQPASFLLYPGWNSLVNCRWLVSVLNLFFSHTIFTNLVVGFHMSCLCSFLVSIRYGFCSWLKAVRWHVVSFIIVPWFILWIVTQALSHWQLIPHILFFYESIWKQLVSLKH